MICFVDYRTTNTEKETLRKFNLDIIEIPKCNYLYPAIDGHVDIQMNIIDKSTKKIIIQNDIPTSFKKKLIENNITYIESSKKLSLKYPDNIFLNAFIDTNHFVHNIKYTDPVLLEAVKDKKIINVNQGYTKCSILPVTETAFITNDPGLFNTLTQEGFDILLLPFGDISLPGLDYGFIGGVGGKISENTIGFFGNLDNYSYGEKVKDFLYKYNIKPIYLHDGKLIDRGSLFVL